MQVAVDMLMGWTLYQFAVAGAWFEAKFGWLPMPSLEAGEVVRSAWMEHHRSEPATTQIIVLLPWCEPRELCYGWAVRTWQKAAMECWPTLRDRRSGTDRRDAAASKN